MIMHVGGATGIGDVTCDSAGVCVDTSQVPISTPNSFVANLPLTTVAPGGLTPAQTTPGTLDLSQLSQPLPCFPAGAQGPLAPGQAYCETGTGALPVTSACPAGSTCTFFSSIPDTWMYGLAAALGVMVLFSMMGGHKH